MISPPVYREPTPHLFWISQKLGGYRIKIIKRNRLSKQKKCNLTIEYWHQIKFHSWQLQCNVADKLNGAFCLLWLYSLFISKIYIIFSDVNFIFWARVGMPYFFFKSNLSSKQERVIMIKSGYKQSLSSWTPLKFIHFNVFTTMSFTVFCRPFRFLVESEER